MTSGAASATRAISVVGLIGAIVPNAGMRFPEFVLAGLYARSDAAARLRDSGVRLAAPTQMEIRYHHPVHGNDVIIARCTVQAVAAPRDGRAGTVVIADECSATDGRPLLSCTRTYEYQWPADA